MLKSYYFQGEPDSPWIFGPFNLGVMNLVVGLSGSGKTRFLNTLFNIAHSISSGSPTRDGAWVLEIFANNEAYKYELIGQKLEEKTTIKFEKLTRLGENGKGKVIFHRENDEFYFKDQKLPKIDKQSYGVFLLKEEKDIEPVYRFFTKIKRRKFFDDTLNRAASYQSISENLIHRIQDTKNIDLLYQIDLSLSSMIYLLNLFFADKMESLINYFYSIFPTIKEFKINNYQNYPLPIDDKGFAPILLFKERSVDKWLPVHDLSSGMIKVLLILTDVITLPEDSIYIIDEYENSLGINALSTLPDFFLENSQGKQFIITSHHPYIINNIPVENWIIFNRKGCEVRSKSGTEIKEKFGRSKQKAFVKLMNEPFYLEGVQ